MEDKTLKAFEADTSQENDNLTEYIAEVENEADEKQVSLFQLYRYLDKFHVALLITGIFGAA